MDWLFVMVLALASNIDNVAAGLSYGVRGVTIGYGTNLFIAAICFLLSLAGTFLGHWMGDVLPGALPNLAGAVLLFVIGFRILLLLVPRRPIVEQTTPSNLWQRITGKLGRLFAVKNGKLGLVEGLLLGIALSANALANAVGAGLLHMPAIAVALTASFGSFVTVSLGVALGLRTSRVRVGAFDLGRFGTLLSGIVLVGLALVRVL